MRRPSIIVPLGMDLDAVMLPVARARAWWERLLGLRVPADAARLRPATPNERLDRYRDAAAMRPMYRDDQLELMREAKGWPYLKAWRAGRFPKILRLRHLVPVPSTTTTRRASSARG